MDLFNLGGFANDNPLLNALGTAPVGMFSGLNPAASAGASIGALPSMNGPDMGAAPLGGSIASFASIMNPALRASLTAPSAQEAPMPSALPIGWSGLLSILKAQGTQPTRQQMPMEDYAVPQAPVSSPNLFPVNQLVGRLLARGGA